MTVSTDIRNAIKGVIEGVADTGVVHAIQPYAKNLADLKVHYLVDDQINGWYISRMRRQETSRHLSEGVEVMRWDIRYFLSLDFANQSEIQFDQTLDNVVDAFRSNETLGDVVTDTVLPNNSEAGLQIVDQGPAMFCGVLVHAARTQLSTVRFTDGSL